MVDPFHQVKMSVRTLIKDMARRGLAVLGASTVWSDATALSRLVRPEPLCPKVSPPQWSPSFAYEGARRGSHTRRHRPRGKPVQRYPHCYPHGSFCGGNRKEAAWRQGFQRLIRGVVNV
ncbi:hypothetical protein GCM10008170_12690 [Methylopila capsulata]|uniref:Uncharacterized protein n=1 Tax=Methylopila capsulata TaxID=61654 RepID=A0A9W6ITY7_9HYPH|nr:hypothetical protein GCM10008170_12690 [Methylopila capsulata]